MDFALPEDYGLEPDDEKDRPIVPNVKTLGGQIIGEFLYSTFGTPDLDPFKVEWPGSEYGFDTQISALGPKTQILFIERARTDNPSEYFTIVRNLKRGDDVALKLTPEEFYTLRSAREGSIAMPSDQAFKTVAYEGKELFGFQLKSFVIAGILDKLSLYGFITRGGAQVQHRFTEATGGVEIVIPEVVLEQYGGKRIGSKMQALPVVSRYNQEWQQKLEQNMANTPLKFEPSESDIKAINQSRTYYHLAKAIVAVPGMELVISKRAIVNRLYSEAHTWVAGQQFDSGSLYSGLLEQLHVKEMLEGQDDNGLYEWNNLYEIIDSISLRLAPWEGGNIGSETIQKLIDTLWQESTDPVEQSSHVKECLHGRTHKFSTQYSREFALLVQKKYLDNPPTPPGWLVAGTAVERLRALGINIAVKNFEQTLLTAELFLRDQLGIEVGRLEYTGNDARNCVDPLMTGGKFFAVCRPKGSMYFSAQFIDLVADIVKHKPGVGTNAIVFNPPKNIYQQAILDLHSKARFLPWLRARLTPTQKEYLAAALETNDLGQYPARELLADALGVSDSAILDKLRGIMSRLTPTNEVYRSDGMLYSDDNSMRLIRILIEKRFDLDSLVSARENKSDLYLALNIVKRYVENGVVPSRNELTEIAGDLGTDAQSVPGIDKIIIDFIRLNSIPN